MLSLFFRSPVLLVWVMVALALSIAPCKREKGDARKRVEIPRPKDRDLLINFQTGPNNYVRALFFDDDDYLWVGTSEGVLKIDRLTEKLVTNYTTKTSTNGLKNNYVFAITIDKKGYKWFGTNGGGLARFNGEKKWKAFVPMHGLADFWVYAFAFEKDGTMWIGTWEGVNRYDGHKFVTYHVKDGLINEWCYGIAIDRDGVKWFGTEGGVSRFDGKTWRSWTHKDGLGAPNMGNLPQSGNIAPGTINRHDLSVDDGKGGGTYQPNYVFAAAIDAQDVKWFGTWGGGVSRFDGKTWGNYTTADGLADNIVYSLAIDQKGVKWFGTHGGVSRFDGKTWRNYTPRNGLISPDIYAIAVDPDNHKWFAQRGGVTKLMEAEGGTPGVSIPGPGAP